MSIAGSWIVTRFTVKNTNGGVVEQGCTLSITDNGTKDWSVSWKDKSGNTKSTTYPPPANKDTVEAIEANSKHRIKGKLFPGLLDAIIGVFSDDSLDTAASDIDAFVAVRAGAGVYGGQGRES